MQKKIVPLINEVRKFFKQIEKLLLKNLLNYCIFFYWFLAALQALKRKKDYEQHLLQIDGTILTIEQQREALEVANINTAILTTMKTTTNALKTAHQNMYVTHIIIINLYRYLLNIFFCIFWLFIDNHRLYSSYLFTLPIVHR